ncbi:MAG: tetratricopeptide repeat protein [Planctomycetota bacterium]
MLRALVVLVLCGANLVAQDDGFGADLKEAQRLFRRGDLRKAEAILQDIVDAVEEGDAPPADVLRQARRGLLELRFRHGDDDAVATGLAQLPAEERDRAPFRLLAIDSALRTGRYAEGEALLRAAIQDAKEGGTGPLRCRLGELLRITGRRAEGDRELQAAADVAGDDAQALSFGARALMVLGGRQNVEEASQRLVAAIRKDPDAWLPRTLYGKLRFDVYGEWSGAESGERTLLDVLERNGEIEEALLALYRIRVRNHLLEPAKTENFLDRALAANPRSVPALLLRGIGWIDDRRFEEGVRFLDQALSINPRDRDVLAERCAAAVIVHDEKGASDYRARALEFDPDWGGVDRAIGERMVALYRFTDAIPYYDAALKRDADDIDALHGQAKALVYAGRGEDARKLLLRAKELQKGYVNPWRNNVIAVQDLLDEEYVTVEQGGFRFWLHKADAAVLQRYLLPFATAAKQSLDAKYGLVPEGPVRFESFHTWDDFSVRTTGFRGFPALGACFGGMITFVSPVDSDLRRNDFMWEATVWHEYTHVLTLGLSRHRVPRWLTEGFSVYEEGQRDKAWERGMERELVDAVANGEIAPIRLFDRVFRGPRILFGYYQGGLLVDFLVREFGFPKVVELLRAYGRDLSAEDAFRETFGVGTAEIDRRFLEDLSERRIARVHLVPHWGDEAVDRFRAAIARDPADHDARIALGWAAVQRGVDVDASVHLREVLARDPNDAEGLLLQAELLRRRGRTEEAIETFERAFAAGAEDFDSRIRLAELLEARGDDDGAMRVYLASKRSWPGCTDQAVAPELRLARLHRKAGREDDAMMELTTYCQRTARAYAPRLELAEYARARGDHRLEAKLLEQSIAIDPFSRAVHRELGEAYVALDRDDAAVREYEALLAITPELDRPQQTGGSAGQPRSVDSAEFRREQAEAAVALARVLKRLGRLDAMNEVLDRALRDDPNGPTADAARELRGR